MNIYLYLGSNVKEINKEFIVLFGKRHQHIGILMAIYQNREIY